MLITITALCFLFFAATIANYFLCYETRTILHDEVCLSGLGNQSYNVVETLYNEKTNFPIQINGRRLVSNKISISQEEVIQAQMQGQNIVVDFQISLNKEEKTILENQQVAKKVTIATADGKTSSELLIQN